MKLLIAASVLAAANAFVVPDAQVFNGLTVHDRHGEKPATSFWSKVPSASGVRKKLAHTLGCKGKHAAPHRAAAEEDVFDGAFAAPHVTEQQRVVDDRFESAFDMDGWLSGGLDNFEELSDDEIPPVPPRGPPPDDEPGQGPGRPGYGKPPHGGPGHGKPRHKSSLTVYEMIAQSKYTTQLAKLINEYEDLVSLLNGTSANFTLFAPTDRAFSKIPEHAPKPSKEFLKKLLTYHVITDLYPAGRVLHSNTIPTALYEDGLGDYQRLAVKFGVKGLMLNFYSGIVAADIFGANGVIHGIDSILMPPPPVSKILRLLPSDFSTLELALLKTGEGEQLQLAPHVGGTFFAPTNWAFKKLGPGANAFLFSDGGLKYLAALLKYHAVANRTLYSDYFHKPDGADVAGGLVDDDDVLAMPWPGGRRRVHVDLPTMLDGRSLPVDITRFGPWVGMMVNGVSRVAVKNGIGRDAVLHVVGDVLVPPKRMDDGGGVVGWDGEEMEVEELVERLGPLVGGGGGGEGAMKLEM